MGCSSSDVNNNKTKLTTTNNFSWSAYNFADTQIGGKRYIFYKTKHHKRILWLRSWLRRLHICVIGNTSDVELNPAIADNEDLIDMIIGYVTYEAEYEHEGNRNETLIVESNTTLVLPSNGKRIYEFRSLHIQQYGVLTVTKWIDCDYHHNIGGILNIYCHENIIIDKHGAINLNGAGLTGLENDSVLITYCGYHQTAKYINTLNPVTDISGAEGKTLDSIDDDEEEKDMPLSQTIISKPSDLYDFESYYISKGGSYFARAKSKKHARKTRKIFYGGIGGGCISMKCKDFVNNGYVLSNGTSKPIKINKTGNNSRDREILSKLKYFANNGEESYNGFGVRVVDVGIDGGGGFICIHIRDDFINNGVIEAMNFGEIVIVQTEADPEGRTKLLFGKCNPYPKAQGAELQEIPTGELL